MGEMWPSRLRGSGMGFVYGVGNLGKFIGPLGLALIAGSSNYVKPQVTMDALIPGFNYFAFWYVLGALAFWLIGYGDARPHDRRDRCRNERPRRASPRRGSGACRRRLTGTTGCQRFWVQSSRHRKSGPSWSRLGQPIWPMTRSISLRKMSTHLFDAGNPADDGAVKGRAGRRTRTGRQGRRRSGCRRRA